MNYLGLLLMIMGVNSGSVNRPMTVSLQNTMNVERIDEAFVLTRDQLKPRDNKVVPVVTTKDGEFVPCQIDDINHDGKWDELAFVCNLEAKENKELQVLWISPDKYPTFTRRTNVRYGKMTSPGHIEELATDMHGKYNLARGEGYPYQTDGPSWENDKMGFRHYFDGRNCRDVFGKLIPQMVMDTVGIRPDGTPGDTYHVMRNWGRDIMSAAGSFGLGGIAIQTPDTLLRMGVLVEDRTDNVDSTRYTLVSEGPVRSMFKLDFYGWDVLGKKVNVNEVVTIWAGKYGYENKIKTSALPAGAYLVSGIVTNNNDKPELQKKYKGKYTAMITHDMQTYNKTWYMGMSLIIPNGNLVKTYDAPKTGKGIVNTWCVKMKPVNGYYNYNVYAAWEISDKRFRDRAYFVNLIDGYGDKLAQPVIMTVK